MSDEIASLVITEMLMLTSSWHLARRQVTVAPFTHGGFSAMA